MIKKRILFLTTTRDFLGKFEQGNVKILQNKGFEVHYAANMQEPHYPIDEEKLKALGVQIHPIAIARSPFLFTDNEKALRQILQLIRRYHIQAIHCHTPVGGLLGRLAGELCREQGVVVVYTAHGFHFYKGAPAVNQLVYYPVEKQLARYTDILIVINEEDYRCARKFRLKRGGHLYKIPGEGLDTARFRPLPESERKRLRNELGIAEEAFFLVSVGELNENKNHGIVLEALEKLRQQQKGGPPIHYGICGDGFLRARLETRIRELGLADMVTLYGYCTNVPEILGCADASVFPSRREGLGMAGLESLAMGVPVIAADNRGTREYMEHGKNGYVCRFDDVDGFARGIEVLRELSPQARAAMAVHCRDTVRPFDKRYAGALMQRVYADVERRIGEAEHEKQRIGQRHYGRV